MKKILFLLIGLSLLRLGVAQEWSVPMGTYAAGGHGSLCKDDPGNLYFMSGFWDLQISKVDKFGHLIWHKSYQPPKGVFSGSGLFPLTGINVDASGNVYGVAGNGTAGLSTILKYSSDGSLIWAKQIGESFNQINAAAVDGSGNSYVVGLDNDVTHGAVRKFDSNGNLSWTYLSNRGNGEMAIALCVAVSPGNGIVVAGTLEMANQTDQIVLKFDANGSIVWSKSLPAPTPGTLLPHLLAVGPDGGVHVFSNYSLGNVSVHQVAKVNAVISKYSASGAFAWEKIIEAQDLQVPSPTVEQVRPLDILVDRNGNIGFIGEFQVGYAASDGHFFTVNEVGYLTPDGVLKWMHRTFPTTDLSYSYAVTASLGFDTIGNIIAAGDSKPDLAVRLCKFSPSGDRLGSAMFPGQFRGARNFAAVMQGDSMILAGARFDREQSPGFLAKFTNFGP